MYPGNRLAMVLLFGLAFTTLSGNGAEEPKSGLGIFQNESDVGGPRHAGAVQFDSATGRYVVSGGGENMWSTNDAFHFIWKKCSGDLTLAADAAMLGTGGNPHRKACLMVRQTLDADSAYADAALHGNGLTSLQFRETKGAPTREIQAAAHAPKRFRLEKRGKYVSMSVAGSGEELHPAGGCARLELRDPFFVGLAVCAHDDAVVERGAFAKVELRENLPPSKRRHLISTLETVALSSKDRRAVYWTTNHIEAPNWSRDGGYFVFNSRGSIYRLPVQGGAAERIETGLARRCNNDHGLSPDGRWLAISDQTEERHSLIYVLPAEGGQPRRLTQLGPSYWHGWSPDGQTLAFCGERGGEFDIYTLPVQGGKERRLTTAAGLDDGPEYSPDGQFIYFNSERSGSMQIWRMRSDGSGQEQVTADGYNNWFPHPSPDGKWMAFLSYDRAVKGHPENQDVMIRVMPMSVGKTEVVAKLFGGQGTINVPSWAPDSKQLAFVSYAWAVEEP